MKFYISSLNKLVDLTTEEIEQICHYPNRDRLQKEAKRFISQIFAKKNKSYLKQTYGTADVNIVFANDAFMDYCVDLFRGCENCGLSEEDLWKTLLPDALKTCKDYFRHDEEQQAEALRKKLLPKKQKKEAVAQMTKAAFPEYLIKSFKNGEVFMSDEHGELRPLVKLEKQLVKDFERKHGSIVFHVLTPEWFMDTLCFLCVSPYEEDFESDREDLKDRIPLAWVYNLADPSRSGLKIIEIEKSDCGGFVAQIL